jgi:hypothetical protein
VNFRASAVPEAKPSGAAESTEIRGAEGVTCGVGCASDTFGTLGKGKLTLASDTFGIWGLN